MGQLVLHGFTWRMLFHGTAFIGTVALAFNTMFLRASPEAMGLSSTPVPHAKTATEKGEEEEEVVVLSTEAHHFDHLSPRQVLAQALISPRFWSMNLTIAFLTVISEFQSFLTLFLVEEVCPALAFCIACARVCVRLFLSVSPVCVCVRVSCLVMADLLCVAARVCVCTRVVLIGARDIIASHPHTHTQMQSESNPNTERFVTTHAHDRHTPRCTPDTHPNTKHHPHVPTDGSERGGCRTEGSNLADEHCCLKLCLRDGV